MAENSAFAPWQELGIAPTTCRLAIRRAYAARLKRIDPLKDRAAFERLRSAYEAALRGTPAEMVSRPPPSDAELDVQERQTIVAIRDLITDGRLAEAFALFERADSGEDLSLGAVNQLDELFLMQTVVAGVPSREPLLALVRRFGWDDAAHPRRKIMTALSAALDHRLAAEAWYGELLKRTEVSNDLWAPPAVLVANLLLRGQPRWGETLGLADWRLMLGGPFRQLRADLEQLDRHWPHLNERFDAERIRWCRRRAFPGRITLLYILVIGMAVAMDILLGVPTGSGRINLPLLAAVVICIALWLTHRVAR